MKATGKQFQLISSVLESGLLSVTSGGGSLSGLLSEVDGIAKDKEAWVLWWLLKVGKHNMYPNDGWAFLDAIDSYGDSLDDSHMLTAMRKWLASKQ